VKTLHTMNAEVMVDPSLVPGEHDVFVSGNDTAAKEEVSALLESFGWSRERILDLGDISGARATEMYVMLWLRLYQAVGTSHFNVRVVR
jgi:predicted dinucleotide-binding enzyme